jgi:hypothetical protein
MRLNDVVNCPAFNAYTIIGKNRIAFQRHAHPPPQAGEVAFKMHLLCHFLLIFSAKHPEGVSFRVYHQSRAGCVFWTQIA